MISSVVVVGALAALARAVPVQERAEVTVTEIADVYTTVYEDAPAATTTSSAKWWWRGGHRKHSTSAAPVTTVSVTPTAAATTSVSTPEAAVTTSPVYSSSEAAATTSPVYSSSEAAATTSPVYSSSEAAAVTPAYTPPAASSSPAPAPTTSASGGGSSSYSQSVVDHHNAHRANHSAPALVWDEGVAATAMKIAQTCVYEHNTKMDNEDGKSGYGQNIAAGCPADNVTSVITELFYNNEEPNFAGLYGQATPSGIDDAASFDGWGHFTQIVWKGTSKVGCATYDCTGKGNGPKGLGNVGSDVAPIFTVCNYVSAGNFIGEFDSNVGSPLGHPTIHWNTLS